MAREKDAGSAGGCRGNTLWPEIAIVLIASGPVKMDGRRHENPRRSLRPAEVPLGVNPSRITPRLGIPFCEFPCSAAPIRGKMFPLTSGRWTTVCTIPRCMS